MFKMCGWIVLSALLLSSCNSSSSTFTESKAENPGNYKDSEILGSFRLSLGESDETLSIQDTTSISGAFLSYISSSSFDVGGMRYLSSTYRVNLPNSRPLDGMTFIPTVTPNTLGNTSVSGMYLWSASQKSMYPVSNAALLSQMARSVMPTGGPMRLYGGRAQLDPQVGPNFQAFASGDFNLLTQKGVLKPGALPFGFTTYYVASSSTTNSIPPRTISKGHYLTLSVKFPLQRTLDITPSRVDLEGILVTGMVKTVTESLEDQATGDRGSAVLKRVSDQQAQVLNILPGSTITSAPPGVVMNKICQIPLTYGGNSVRNNTTVYLVNQAGKGFLGMLPGFAEIKGNASVSVRFSSLEPGCNILDPQNPQNQLAIYGSQTGLRLANFNPANRGTFSQKPQTWNYTPAPGAEFKPGEELVVTALDPHYPRSYVAKFRVESAPESQSGFVANPLIDMGSGPSDLRLIDLNRDGVRDMVTLFKSAGFLATQLISGGALQPVQKLLLQGTPNALDFGLINGDFNPDMVIANDGLPFPSVQVLLGQGNGSFKYDQDVYLGGIKPTRVKLDEFNLSEDNLLDTDSVPLHSKFLPDIAFLSPGSASIGISPRSQDNAAFEVAPLLTVPVSNQPDTTTFGYGDFNSDGRYDLVTGHPNGSVRITWGKLNGSFAPLNEQALLTAGGSDVQDIEVADLNGDCLEEILVAHNNPPGLTVFWQQQTEVPMGSNSCYKGVGTFSAHTYTLSGQGQLLVPDRIQFVNIDQNEGVDLALVDSSNGRVGLLKNTTLFDLSNLGNQLTSLGVISAGPSLSAVAITDVTSDTVPDLLLAYAASDGLGLLKGNALGLFGVQVPAYPVGSLTQSLALGDVNGDGHLDSVSAGFGGGQNQLVVLKGSAGGLNPWLTLQLPSGGNPGKVLLGDFNADGRLDLVAAIPELKVISLFLQNAAGGFGDRRDVVMDGTPGGMTSGDFNEDGRLDLVVASGDSGGVRVLMGDVQAPFASTLNIPMGAGMRFVSTEDLNQDGHLDVMAVGSANIQAWLQDANGGFARLFSYSLAEKAPNTAVFGDVSGDGITDVVLGYANANRLDVLTRTGNTFQKTSLNTFPSLANIEMGDLNGDHVLDVVTTHRSDSLVGIFWGQGSSQFKAREGWMSTGSGQGTVALGDLNRDGRLDIVTATTEQGVDSLRVIFKR